MKFIVYLRIYIYTKIIKNQFFEKKKKKKTWPDVAHGFFKILFNISGGTQKHLICPYLAQRHSDDNGQSRHGAAGASCHDDLQLWDTTWFGRSAFFHREASRTERVFQDILQFGSWKDQVRGRRFPKFSVWSVGKHLQSTLSFLECGCGAHSKKSNGHS